MVKANADIYIFFFFVWCFSVPCVPQNVSTDLDCATNDLTVRWEYSHGADFYIASAAGPDGAAHICQTADTSCVIPGLSCGRSYAVYVVASNFKCNSSESVRVIRETGMLVLRHHGGKM